MNNIPNINSHNSWSKLEEVWLGDVYPREWYNHLEPEVRDVFYRITDTTKEDLSVIEKFLSDSGIKVIRPQYKNIDDHLDFGGNMLIKPEITPRDHYLTLDNTLYIPPWKSSFSDVFDEYIGDGISKIESTELGCVNGANVVRYGKNVLIDNHYDQTRTDQVQELANSWTEHTTKVVNNGGHLDGCFAILKPGLILASQYFEDYETHFPGWKVIELSTPTYHRDSLSKRPPYPGANGKFWEVDNGANKSFNSHVIQHALDWVGTYTETYFELNCLVLDEKNVMMSGMNDQLEIDLKRHGITVHWMPFRNRAFWDGGMHCLTVDIRRQSKNQDYFM